MPAKRYRVKFREYIRNGNVRDVNPDDTIISKNCMVRDVEQIAVCGNENDAENIKEIIKYYDLKGPNIVNYSIKLINNMKESKDMKKNIIKLNETQLRKVVAESVKRVLKEYDQNVEDWWRHNGNFDREQASGMPYNNDDNYLQKTDALQELKKVLTKEYFEKKMGMDLYEAVDKENYRP